MPVHTDFISAFLTRMEERHCVAYIPCRRKNFDGHNKAADCGDPVGQSGVTVGAGLDLGQQSEADLRRMGLDPELIGLFRPYLGKKRHDAVLALSRATLTVSEEQCDAVNRAVHGDYIRRAADLYDRSTESRSFAEQPQEAQAVIVSLFYQLGSPFPVKNHSGYPALYGRLCRGDWRAAARELKTGFRNYASRRRQEGELLEGIA
ncbi:MAG: pesticin C-terminus-like muramidase [Desulfovibrio sp.]|uniref:pesticin C-terminus-like muramidase n=1 Tax=Desulfovibrio sp. TaxID=885 RepID=UPI0025841F0B|nr:pesticin C-terminus-like muramidase [Desulfovibrio sp.]MCD7984146.1 pesticin C-terminus-like muramidase [Desulfovibrio sp.]